MLDLASTYFSVFGLATECRKHMQEATPSDSYMYLNIRLMNIQLLTSVDPSSVSHVEVSKYNGLTCTQMLPARISSPSESKADLNKLLRSYPTGLVS